MDGWLFLMINDITIETPCFFCACLHPFDSIYLGGIILKIGGWNMLKLSAGDVQFPCSHAWFPEGKHQNVDGSGWWPEELTKGSPSIRTCFPSTQSAMRFCTMKPQPSPTSNGLQGGEQLQAKWVQNWTPLIRDSQILHHFTASTQGL